MDWEQQRLEQLVATKNVHAHVSEARVEGYARLLLESQERYKAILTRNAQPAQQQKSPISKGRSSAQGSPLVQSMQISPVAQQLAAQNLGPTMQAGPSMGSQLTYALRQVVRQQEQALAETPPPVLVPQVQNINYNRRQRSAQVLHDESETGERERRPVLSGTESVEVPQVQRGND